MSKKIEGLVPAGYKGGYKYKGFLIERTYKRRRTVSGRGRSMRRTVGRNSSPSGWRILKGYGNLIGSSKTLEEATKYIDSLSK